jgi:hypothetical protein
MQLFIMMCERNSRAKPRRRAPRFAPINVLIAQWFYLHTLHLNGAIDPNGIPFAGNFKVNCWRQIINTAL